MRRLAALMLAGLSWGGCAKQVLQPQQTKTAAAAKKEASPITAQTARERANKLFESRDEPKKLADAISLYEKAASLEPTPQGLLRLARAYEMLGRLQRETPDGQREAAKHYVSGMQAAQKVLAQNNKGSTDLQQPAKERFAKLKREDAEALYYYALLQWRWAQTQGTAVELSVRQEVLAAAERTAALDPTFLGAAPYRLLGELYAELPIFASGDLERSREYFADAISLAPNALENRGALARTYAQKADPNLARALWEEILAADPTQEEALAPENRVEQKKAKAALAKQ